ncbi:MAG TPA: hypothetical protein ENN22_11630 [bacterium]|nr:hypothetical protein [bacterium]
MLKKIIPGLIVCLMLLSISTSVLAEEATTSGSSLNKALTRRAVKYIDINTIRSSVMNNGTFTRHPISGNADMEWPKGSGKTICYAAGIWIAGLVNDEIRTACADYNVEYQPGNILPDGTPDDPSKAEYRVFKVQKDAPNGDADLPPGVDPLELDTWADWQTYAEKQGAPRVADEDGNWIGFGDQMLYAVMNDLDQNLHNGCYNTLPIGIELHLLVFGFDRSGALGNTIFSKYTVINKGKHDLQEAYIGAWADVDLGDANDDMIGFDLERGMSYCYNGKDIDSEYGSRPPALGWDFFQGPIINSPGDTVKLPDGRIFPDKKKLDATSFNKYYNSHAIFRDPPYSAQGAEWVYNYLAGLTKEGDPWVNPITGEETTFLNTGDPVTGEGWLSSHEAPPQDIRMLTGSGPFTLAVGDTQEIVLGCIIGQGTNRLTSIEVLRFYNQEAQQAYDLGFEVPSPPPAPRVAISELDRKVLLQWEDNAEHFESSYQFEGYNVYIGASAAGPWKRLETFDIINDLDVILQPTYDTNTGLILDMPAAFGSNQGLKYRYLFTHDYNGFQFANGREYYVMVTAYAYDPHSLPNVLESSFSVLRVKPHKPRPGTVYSHDVYSEVQVAHTAGQANPRKWDLWIKLIDPLRVETAQYKITANEDQSWTLLKNGVEVPGYTNRTDYGINTNIEYRNLDSLDFFIGVDFNFKWDQLVSWEPQLIAGNEQVLEGLTSPYRQKARLTDFAKDGQYRTGTKSPELVNNHIQIRFTGVMDSSTMKVVSGGSKATLIFGFGDPANFMTKHPENPNPGSRDPFLLQVPFELWDVTRNIQLNCAFTDNAQKITEIDSGTFVPTWAPRGKCVTYVVASPYDEQIHNITPAGGDTMATWTFVFDVNTVWRTGDIVQLTIPDPDTFPKPVVGGEDEWTFSLQGETRGVVEDAKKRLNIINVFPNPYLAFSLEETQLHEEHVTFINLPERCTIRMFTIAGQLVRTIEHDDPTETTHRWDLRNENNLPIASGFYIAHIDVPNVGEKILKMAIIFRQQRLKNL